MVSVSKNKLLGLKKRKFFVIKKYIINEYFLLGVLNDNFIAFTQYC